MNIHSMNLKKAELIKTENRMVVTRGWGGGELGDGVTTNLQLVDK